MIFPRLTVVTTNRNYGHYLDAAIRSVLDQAYPNLEYLVLDAASQDDSPAIIRRYAPHLAYWHSRPDDGPASALHFALTRATGEWFYYLNSDDTLLPGALARFAAIAPLARNTPWLSGGREETDAHGHTLRTCLPWRDQPHLFATGTMMHAAEGTFLHLPTLRRHGLNFDPAYRSIFDTVLYTQLDRLSPPLYTDAYFARMRLHGDNLSGAKNISANQAEARRHSAKLPTEPLFRRLVERLERTRYRASLHHLLTTAVRSGLLARTPARLVALAQPDNTYRVVPLRTALRA